MSVGDNLYECLPCKAAGVRKIGHVLGQPCPQENTQTPRISPEKLPTRAKKDDKSYSLNSSYGCPPSINHAYGVTQKLNLGQTLTREQSDFILGYGTKEHKERQGIGLQVEDAFVGIFGLELGGYTSKWDGQSEDSALWNRIVNFVFGKKKTVYSCKTLVEGTLCVWGVSLECLMLKKTNFFLLFLKGQYEIKKLYPVFIF